MDSSYPPSADQIIYLDDIRNDIEPEGNNLDNLLHRIFRLILRLEIAHP
jgi:hypothetical protein